MVEVGRWVKLFLNDLLIRFDGKLVLACPAFLGLNRLQLISHAVLERGSHRWFFFLKRIVLLLPSELK